MEISGMKTQSNEQDPSKVSFYSRKNNTRSVFIEGFANRYKEGEDLLVDRGNDLVEPKGWDLKNFSSNAIILFNHDRDSPVGRAVKVEKNDDGLFIKAKLSDSDHPEVSRIRDLVKDGVLRTFSVGFNPKMQGEEDVNGKAVNVIKEAELLEVSIVSLPMAERSLFNVTAKHLSDVPYDIARQACLGETKLLNEEGNFTNEIVEIIDLVSKGEEEETPNPDPEPTPPTDGAAEEISSQPKEEPTNPMMDVMRQTNILLSNLISEVRLMSQKLDSKVDEEEGEEAEETAAEPSEEEPDEEMMEDGEDEEEEEAKKLKLVDDIHDDCDRILRKYGY